MANVSSFSGAMPVIPGGEIEVARVTRTTDYTVSATSLAGAADVFSPALTFVADGSTYIVEFYCEFMFTGTTAGSFVTGSIVNSSGTEIAKVASVGDANGTGHGGPVLTRYWYTPSAGSTTINFRAFRGTSNGSLRAASPSAPMYLRVVKPVNQNNGLKPFWTPPVVTQLPSQATVGDQVIYAADATNGVYWHLQYDGLGTYPWKFIGGTPMQKWEQSLVTTAANTSNVDLGGPNITIPLAGDYLVGMSGWLAVGAVANGHYVVANIAYNGSSLGAGYEIGMGAPAVAGNYYSLAMQPRSATLATGGQVLSMRYNANPSAGTCGFQYRNLIATPIRVKAA